MNLLKDAILYALQTSCLSSAGKQSTMENYYSDNYNNKLLKKSIITLNLTSGVLANEAEA